MIVEYNASQCGAGKTVSLTAEMGSQPGRYLYIVDRLEVMAEREAMIRASAEAAGLSIHVEAIFSKDGRGGEDSVATRLAALPSRFVQHPHVVVIATAKGMMSTEFASAGKPDFGGWEIVIDEDISTFTSREVTSPAFASWYATNFEIVPRDSSPLLQIVALPSCPTVGDILADSDLRHVPGLVEFRRLVDRGEVITEECNWNRVAKGEGWSWFSVWSFRNLASFQRVRIVANAFDERLTHLLASRNDGVTFRPFDLSTTRPAWASRFVLVRYFTDKHRAGSRFWKEMDEGREARDEAFRWIAREASSDHVWVANSRYQPPVDVPGLRISSKCHGLNDYRAVGEVSAIYAAKGAPSEERAVAALCGLTIEEASEALARDRELEDLVQIVLRTSLRDPRNSQPVVVTVYDRTQAEFLVTYLNENGFGATVEMELIESDVNFERVRNVGGRPPIAAKAMTNAENHRAKRARVSTAKQSADRQRRRQAKKQRSA